MPIVKDESKKDSSDNKKKKLIEIDDDQ